MNDLNPKIDDEDVEVKDDIVKGLCVMLVSVWGVCLGSINVVNGMKSQEIGHRLYIRKSCRSTDLLNPVLHPYPWTLA